MPCFSPCPLPPASQVPCMGPALVPARAMPSRRAGSQRVAQTELQGKQDGRDDQLPRAWPGQALRQVSRSRAAALANPWAAGHV